MVEEERAMMGKQVDQEQALGQFVCSGCHNPIFTVETVLLNGKLEVKEDGYAEIRLKCSYCERRFPFEVKKRQPQQQEQQGGAQPPS